MPDNFGYHVLMKQTLSDYVDDDQKTAAEKLGVSQQAVAKHMAGGGFSFEIGCRYREIYGVPEWLLRQHVQAAKEKTK